jgi:CHASE2 domain-containing sensor protein
MFPQALMKMGLRSGIHASSSAIAALAWWIVPIVAVLGAIAYAIWVSKFKDNYENETHRSVGNFSAFQATFRNKHHKDKNQ